MASTYLNRSAVTGDRRTFTISAWVKRSELGTEQQIYSSRSSSSNVLGLYFQGSNDTLIVTDYQSGGTMSFTTSAVYRDVSAWYHIVLAVDTTQATDTNRVKLYVNGEQATFSASSYPTLNRDLYINVSGSNHYIGTEQSGRYFNGSMTHIHFIDGTAYDATAFGSTDATTGEWKINTSPSVTYGTNGFFILKDGNTITDSSTNSNDFTLGAGTLTNTEDNPSNVFATLNPLNVPTSNAPTFSNGNTQSVSSSSASGAFGGSSTIGVSSGKWYMEAKCLTSGHTQSAVGVTYNDAETARTNNGATDSYEYSYRMNGNKGHDNTDSSYGNTYTTNDIIGVALDLDNNKIYFSKNGTFQNSGVPTSGATGTGAAFTVDSGQTYMFYHHDTTGASSNTSTFAFNFGNGYFGTTAVSSAGTNASGNGIFEYDLPTGYNALSTKGLNL